jgi:predicted extracellular nuclease
MRAPGRSRLPAGYLKGRGGAVGCHACQLSAGSSWFTEDFTLAELKTLRAKERLSALRQRNTIYNGRYTITTQSRHGEGRPRRRMIRSLAAPALLAVLGPGAAPAGAASPDVVVSQVYGGGNAGATLTNDYVQLTNRGSTAVDLSTRSVQCASATGSTWQVTPLTDGIAPAARYLVGYGSAASSFEGSGPAPGRSSTMAALRSGGGTVDTDDNAADFAAGTPAPGGGPPPPPPGVPARIHDIQGAAHLSPLADARVVDVPGVVTAVAANRFFLQDPKPDADPATSEAVVVFTGSAPSVAAGDAVTVSGTVQEFRSGGADGTNLTTTEITSPAVVVRSSGNSLPEATLVGPGGRVPPATVIEDDATGSVETSGTFDVAADGIDFWESMEAMRVRIDDPQVVGPTNAFGETPVVPAGAGPRTNRGGIVVTPPDSNPERVVIDNALAAVPAANVGDSYAGPVTGVLDYAFGLFDLLPSASPQLRSGGLQREATRSQRARELAVATFNVENLSPLDPPAKFATLARQIVRNLAAPDLVALEEIQDDTGPTDDGVVAADRTRGALVTAIEAAGGPHYAWREIDPLNDQDGGQPGGNIRQAFLFRIDRGLSFVDRPGGDATTPVAVLPGPRLSVSPGRIDPANPAFAASRKPLVGEFRWHGRRIFVVANHFNSKGGDQPLLGRFQPPAHPSETQRHAQAATVRAFADAVLARDRTARIVVLGDVNDFESSRTADILVGDGSLVDLPRTLPAPERYTYVFEGNSQVLDHILISRALADPPGAKRGYEYDIVHTNSEFADQASDHEPQVVRLSLGG